MIVYGTIVLYHSEWSIEMQKKNDLNDPGWGLKMLLETFGLLNRS